MIDEEKLNAALEAARWSPSAANTQPWRFIVARRGTPAFDAIVANLLGFNAAWAGSAGALIVALAEVIDPEGNERRWANYDLGQAVAHLTIQAHHDGLHAHQMGGFDAQGLREAFDIDERFVPDLGDDPRHRRRPGCPSRPPARARARPPHARRARRHPRRQRLARATAVRPHAERVRRVDLTRLRNEAPFVFHSLRGRRLTVTTVAAGA